MTTRRKWTLGCLAGFAALCLLCTSWIWIPKAKSTTAAWSDKMATAIAYQPPAQVLNPTLAPTQAPTEAQPPAVVLEQASMTPAPQGSQVIQESTDSHWIVVVFPVKNTNSTCDKPATLGEWHGCDQEVLQKLLDLYKGQPGAGIVYVNSYIEAGQFLISRGWDPKKEIRGFHLEEFRLDPLHDGEGRIAIEDLKHLPVAADHDGGFLMTWDVNPSLFKWTSSMTPVP